jgi:hypothetical protein
MDLIEGNLEVKHPTWTNGKAEVGRQRRETGWWYTCPSEKYEFVMFQTTNQISTINHRIQPVINQLGYLGGPILQ